MVVFFGLLAGLTTMLANAAGPVALTPTQQGGAWVVTCANPLYQNAAASSAMWAWNTASCDSSICARTNFLPPSL